MSASQEHINITLLYQGQSDKTMDLRIPSNITVYRFIRELNQIFNKEGILPKYQIKVLNKGLLLDEEKKLSDYPIASGDIIEVLGE